MLGGDPRNLFDARGPIRTNSPDRLIVNNGLKSLFICLVGRAETIKFNDSFMAVFLVQARIKIARASTLCLRIFPIAVRHR